MPSGPEKVPLPWLKQCAAVSTALGATSEPPQNSFPSYMRAARKPVKGRASSSPSTLS